jgi:hypothetical protein
LYEESNIDCVRRGLSLQHMPLQPFIVPPVNKQETPLSSPAARYSCMSIAEQGSASPPANCGTRPTGCCASVVSPHVSHSVP